MEGLAHLAGLTTVSQLEGFYGSNSEFEGKIAGELFDRNNWKTNSGETDYWKITNAGKLIKDGKEDLYNEDDKLIFDAKVAEGDIEGGLLAIFDMEDNADTRELIQYLIRDEIILPNILEGYGTREQGLYILGKKWFDPKYSNFINYVMDESKIEVPEYLKPYVKGPEVKPGDLIVSETDVKLPNGKKINYFSNENGIPPYFLLNWQVLYTINPNIVFTTENSDNPMLKEAFNRALQEKAAELNITTVQMLERFVNVSSWQMFSSAMLKMTMELSEKRRAEIYEVNKKQVVEFFKGSLVATPFLGLFMTILSGITGVDIFYSLLDAQFSQMDKYFYGPARPVMKTGKAMDTDTFIRDFGISAISTIIASYSIYNESVYAFRKDLAMKPEGYWEGWESESGYLLDKSDDAASNTVKVIGRITDTSVAKKWSGYEVLDIDDWTLQKNMEWIDEGIKNKQTFYAASPEAGNLTKISGLYKGQPTVYALEIKRLQDVGYIKIGDYWVHPDNVVKFIMH